MENICDWKNCNNLGKFKAPKEKDNSKEDCSMNSSNKKVKLN